MFCERRAALVHIERLWAENRFTAEGRHLHERAHGRETEVRGNVRIARGLALRSLRLGLSGKADVVEFHLAPADQLPELQLDVQSSTKQIVLKGVAGSWNPFPVEYKRGKQRHENGFEVQLCAQALCLEEMIEVEVPAGAIYYGKSGRRMDVVFDLKLRKETEDAAARLHDLIRSEQTPPALYGKKCEKCSMMAVCLPKTTGSKRSTSRYLARAFQLDEGEPS